MAKIGYPLEVTGNFGKDVDLQVESEAIAWAGFKAQFINDMKKTYGTFLYTGESLDENNNQINLVDEELFNEIEGRDDWGERNSRSGKILAKLGFNDKNRARLREAHGKSCVNWVKIQWHNKMTANANQWKLFAEIFRMLYVDVAKVILTSTPIEYEIEYRAANGEHFSHSKKDELAILGMEDRFNQTNGVMVFPTPSFGVTNRLVIEKKRLDQMFRESSIEMLDSTGLNINNTFSAAEIEIMRLFLFADRDEMFTEESEITNITNTMDYGSDTSYTYQTYDAISGTEQTHTDRRVGLWEETTQEVTYLVDMNETNMEQLNRRFSEIDVFMDLEIDQEFIDTTNQAIRDLEANTEMDPTEKAALIAELQDNLLGLDPEDFRIWIREQGGPLDPTIYTFRQIMWDYLVEINREKMREGELLMSRYDASGNFIGKSLSVKKVRKATKEEWSYLVLENMVVNTKKSSSFLCDVKTFFIGLAMAISGLINFVVDILYKIPSIKETLEVLAWATSEVFGINMTEARAVTRQIFTAVLIIIVAFFTGGTGLIAFGAAALAGGLYAIAYFIVMLAIELALIYANIQNGIANIRADKIRKAQKKLGWSERRAIKKKEFQKMGVSLRLIEIDEVDELYLMEPGEVPEIEVLNEEIK